MFCSTHSRGLLVAPAGSIPCAWLKVKIRNLERKEPPHATVLHKTRAWRFDLRSLRFLDKEPDPAEVPDEVVAEIKRQLELLRREWDAMYPENPIESAEGEKGARHD
jgi:hypothetical protein